MHFWVVNPFDQLPHETDVPLRYWTLCRMLAERGHAVVWWSSDFSHLNKAKRPPSPGRIENPDGSHFHLRLIPTPPYRRNISLARLRNHRAFARGFYREAMAALRTGEFPPPDRIVVSLPPLGVAEQAFRLRGWAEGRGRSAEGEGGDQGIESDAGEHRRSGPRSRVASAPDPCAPDAPEPATATPQPGAAKPDCQVIVDIMDAWPEVFCQVLPEALRKPLGPLIFAPLHRSARRAYRNADKIGAVGQSYLDLAADYLDCSQREGTGAKAPGYGMTRHLTPPSGFGSQPLAFPPFHLCYHGTELDRFAPVSESSSDQSTPQPLNAVYLGAMGPGYDLQTIIRVAAKWKAEDRFPARMHFAGTGPGEAELRQTCHKLGLTLDPSPTAPRNLPSSELQKFPRKEPRVVFHGYLQREAATELLRSADLALVPNRPGSLVACPYKAAEYAAAGLPMLSCLGGELDRLLALFQAGASYTEGDTASLDAALTAYTDHPNRLAQAQKNARRLAERCFDRERSYGDWIGFLETSGGEPRTNDP